MIVCIMLTPDSPDSPDILTLLLTISIPYVTNTQVCHQRGSQRFRPRVFQALSGPIEQNTRALLVFKNMFSTHD